MKLEKLNMADVSWQSCIVGFLHIEKHQDYLFSSLNVSEEKHTVIKLF